MERFEKTDKLNKTQSRVLNQLRRLCFLSLVLRHVFFFLLLFAFFLPFFNLLFSFHYHLCAPSAPPQQKGNTSQVPHTGSCQLDGFLQTKQSPLGWEAFLLLLCLISEAAGVGWILQSDLVRKCCNTIDNSLRLMQSSLQTISALQDPEDCLYAHFFNCGKPTGAFVNHNIDWIFFFFNSLPPRPLFFLLFNGRSCIVSEASS